jgi:hypothetical protein
MIEFALKSENLFWRRFMSDVTSRCARVVLCLSAFVTIGRFSLTGTALAGSAATVLTNCGTISSQGNYVLGRNITVSGTCFTITSGNVGLDLGGHTITGNGTGQGIRDLGANSANYTVIANGTITNFGQAIDLSNSSNVTIGSVNVSFNSGSGITIGGCCNTLTNIKANNGSGVAIGGCCNTLSTIQADNNGSYGIYVQGGSNFGTGIEVDANGTGIFMGAGFNSLTSTTANNNLLDGIQLNDGHSSVANSTASGNAANGVRFSYSGATGVIPGNNLVTNTTASGNGNDGIGETGAAISIEYGDEVTNSTANRNHGHGIFLVCPSNALGNSAAYNSGGNWSRLHRVESAPTPATMHRETA